MNIPKPIKLGVGPFCEPHGLTLPCALCQRGAWPLRDLKAVADFAGRPVDGDQMDREPKDGASIRLSEVIRIVGRRWIELERVKQTVLNPIYNTKISLMKEIRIGAVDVPKLERACYLLAKGLTTTTEDAIVAHYMKTILEDESPW